MGWHGVETAARGYSGSQRQLLLGIPTFRAHVRGSPGSRDSLSEEELEMSWVLFWASQDPAQV